MRYRIAMLFIVDVFLCTTVLSQRDFHQFPMVGHPCPDIALKNVQFYPRKDARVSEFRGQWVVLDFWHRWCSSCIASFPHTDSMQKLFAGKVQFFLVGREDPESQIRILYERVRAHYHLDLPIVFDSALHNSLDIGACPFIIVIDPKGVVQAITPALSSQDLTDLIDGKHPKFSDSPYETDHPAYRYDEDQPFAIHDNGGSDTNFISRSMLSYWKPDMPRCNFNIGQAILDSSHNKKFEVLFISLHGLYNYAFFGYDHWIMGDSLYNTNCVWPIIELKNKTAQEARDSFYGTWYCYSAINKNGMSLENVKRSLLEDLNRNFPYTASIEAREIPCYNLVRIYQPGARFLPLNKPVSKNGIVSASLNLSNEPMLALLGTIWSYNQLTLFFDETGITTPISLKQDVVMTDLEAIKKCLRLYGLDLVQSTRLMKVVVIRDK